MSKKIELISAILVIVLVSFCIIFLSVKNQKLREQIYQERLESTEAYYENEINWLEDYYKMKIELLDKDTLDIYQIMNDLDDLMEWTIRYYEVESQTLRDEMGLTEYILWKDSKLYNRILNKWR